MATFELDAGTKSLVSQGLITVTVVFTMTGEDVWARPCRNHPRLGVGPHCSMTMKEASATFKSYLKDPSPPSSPSNEVMRKEEGQIKGIPSPPSPSQEVIEKMGNLSIAGGLAWRPRYGSGPEKTPKASHKLDTSDTNFRKGGEKFSVLDWGRETRGENPESLSDNIQKIYGYMASMSKSRAEGLISARELMFLNVKGVQNRVPDNSLSTPDLDRPDIRHLFARMVAVAAKLGNQKIVSRIRTAPDLTVEGVSNLTLWWVSATPQQRLRVLSESKRLNISKVGETALLAVRSLPCPFRGGPEDLALPLPEGSYVEYETAGSGSEGEGDGPSSEED